MRRRLGLLFAAVTLSFPPLSPVLAWWDEGHMQIAAIAYDKLDAPVKAKVDALLKLNADYDNWSHGAPDVATGQKWAFVHAATWAVDIKDRAPKYTDDKEDTGPIAHQNLGYDDLNMHKYWHFKDFQFSPDGTQYTTLDPSHANAVTALNMMIAALPESSGASPSVRSCDLVWILHLVGDLHQPLHAVSRYTREIPDGDGGANAETVIPATGDPIALHFYWDSIFGGYASPYGTIYDAKPLTTMNADDKAAKKLDPEKWAEESADLAKRWAYAAPPIGPGKSVVWLTREYETAAHSLAKTQAVLAAARLANVLNAALK